MELTLSFINSGYGDSWHGAAPRCNSLCLLVDLCGQKGVIFSLAYFSTYVTHSEVCANVGGKKYIEYLHQKRCTQKGGG